MAFKNRTTIPSAVVAVAVTATLVYYGTGLFPRWPLLWFAALPVLLFAQRNSWWATGLVAFLGWGLGALNLQHYFGAVLQIPASVQVAIFATPALLFAVSVLLFRALLQRNAWWSALLAFPATYAAFEYLLNLNSPHGTAGSLAYSQLNFLPFLQLASITGPWGMTFFSLLFSSGLAAFIHLRGIAPKRAMRILGMSWGLLTMILIFGAFRLANSAQVPKVKVGLLHRIFRRIRTWLTRVRRLSICSASMQRALRNLLQRERKLSSCQRSLACCWRQMGGRVTRSCNR